ncbi:hypothetical protein [Salinimicrobium sediminilitoris]|uniref:hypothetical protein n=1 Tax=Salinimicrobium sediminilitoris TaxID=2876715 RepID=UPI001E615A26|nr:hypothetical protein [Salinimicrobium sediminilitoris]MCC8360622.1 hypothetical protein [Salinimicrobium sediminilitoris]
MTLSTILLEQRQVNVPVELLIDAQKKGYQKKLRLFLLLKLMFPSGKTRLSRNEMEFILMVEKIKSRKTFISYFDFLLDKSWIYYNSRTGYFILKSLDRIREENEWKGRWAIPVNFTSYRKLKAVIGAVIFGFLHKDFHRKLRRKKSVLVKGGTYNFQPGSLLRMSQTAPVSVYGAAILFNISVSTASRLKQAAEKEKLLEVKKNFGDKTLNKEMAVKCLKYNDMNNEVVYHNGGYRLQLIDAILPLFLFVRRKKLKP